MYRQVLDNPHSVENIANLAQALAASGATRQYDASSADIASTGGPSSLSTLLCPLYLVAAGLRVPKIGVPGRPAGGIDTLGTLAGYRTTMSMDEVDKGLAEASYVHILADATWAPADAALFRLRQQEGNQAVPALAIASLLAKKLAAGVGIAALEARIAPYGNFGPTIEEGLQNAALYCRVAVELGLHPIVVLTDARSPFQPFIGRGEGLTALWKVVTGDIDDALWLAEHAKLCLDMVKAVANHASSEAVAPGFIGAQPLEVLAAHLSTQGTSIDALVHRIQESSWHTFQTLTATADGYVRFNLERMRFAIGELGKAHECRMPAETEVAFDDPAGVRLLQPPGSRVQRGEPIIQLRSNSDWPRYLASDLFVITDHPGPMPNAILEVISE